MCFHLVDTIYPMQPCASSLKVFLLIVNIFIAFLHCFSSFFLRSIIFFLVIDLI